MDTYIVRVYRRGVKPAELIGLVETIGKYKHDQFKSFPLFYRVTQMVYLSI